MQNRNKANRKQGWARRRTRTVEYSSPSNLVLDLAVSGNSITNKQSQIRRKALDSRSLGLPNRIKELPLFLELCQAISVDTVTRQFDQRLSRILDIRLKINTHDLAGST